MRYKLLGKSGLRVSEICLGTMTFGASVDEPEAIELTNLALDAGINFFDTADGYTLGRSEEIRAKR